MKNKAYITQLLDYFQYSQSDTMDFHAEAILSDYQEGSSNQSLQIKLLSVFGGILASLAFLGFLGITGLYESGTGLLFFGIVFITGAVSIKRDQHNIIIDTVSVGIFIIGYLMLGVGLMQLRINHNLVWFFLMIIAIITLIFSDSYIQSFLSVLIINGSMFTLIVSNEYYYLIHAAISLLTLLMSYCIVQEARIITIHNRVVQKYNPIRIGLVLSFLAGLFFIGKKDIIPLAPHSIWLSSVIIIPMITVLDETEQGFWEGCLSVPELRGLVYRPKKIQIDYLDLNAEPQQIIAEDFLATVFQHELDHLFGVLFVDRVRYEPGKSPISFIEEYQRFLVPKKEDSVGEMAD